MLCPSMCVCAVRVLRPAVSVSQTMASFASPADSAHKGGEDGVTASHSGGQQRLLSGPQSPPPRSRSLMVVSLDDASRCHPCAGEKATPGNRIQTGSDSLTCTPKFRLGCGSCLGAVCARGCSGPPRRPSAGRDGSEEVEPGARCSACSCTTVRSMRCRNLVGTKDCFSITCSIASQASHLLAEVSAV